MLFCHVYLLGEQFQSSFLWVWSQIDRGLSQIPHGRLLPSSETHGQLVRTMWCDVVPTSSSWDLQGWLFSKLTVTCTENYRTVLSLIRESFSAFKNVISFCRLVCVLKLQYLKHGVVNIIVTVIPRRWNGSPYNVEGSSKHSSLGHLYSLVELGGWTL